ncbi:MAG: hypothetical protein DRI89_08505 [Bacteroidetes bacterium]|nr:MAG: hypothetical protein DRI89_08505 [Bacteroidota bacterium]
MFRYVKLLIFLLLAFASLEGYSQFDTEEFDSLENKILYNRQQTFGVVFHNLGLGIQFRTGKRLSIFKTRMWEFEFVSMKSYKQIRIQSYYPNARSYFYGKLNNAYFLRAGIVWKKLLNRKPYWGGVELRFIYGGGVSIGIAKPYYYYIIYPNPDGITGRLQLEKFSAKSQSNTDIYGRGPFSKGLNEITLHPGIHLKTGLNFEFGVRNTKIKSIEVGGGIDIIPMGLSILANNPNQILFPNLYLSISWGKRFNKY